MTGLEMVNRASIGALELVADHYRVEVGRLHVTAGLTTARLRKDALAQAAYASVQERHWRQVIRLLTEAAP